MRKREREITLLYGISLIRDDVLNHPATKYTAKDMLIIAISSWLNAGVIGAAAMSASILVITFIP